MPICSLSHDTPEWLKDSYLHLTAGERDLIWGALRLYQSLIGVSDPVFEDIATNGHRHPNPVAGDIDALIEKLNDAPTDLAALQ